MDVYVLPQVFTIKTTVKAEDTSKLIKRDDDENSKNDFDMDKDIMKKFDNKKIFERVEHIDSQNLDPVLGISTVFSYICFLVWIVLYSS